jgi:uncharacterized membrane protein YphA (DoxX/SURF4 family)
MISIVQRVLAWVCFVVALVTGIGIHVNHGHHGDQNAMNNELILLGGFFTVAIWLVWAGLGILGWLVPSAGEDE